MIYRCTPMFPLEATTITTPLLKHGEHLFDLEVETQLSILKELAAHKWNPDYPTDLGITSA